MLTQFVVALLVVGLALSDELPKDYDSRTKWPHCVMPILNQGRCGSCWAFSSTTSLSTRFCIYAHKHINETKFLSPQNLLNCEKDNKACNGGSTLKAYKFMRDHGITSLDCVGYKSGETGKKEGCNKACDNGDKLDNFRAKQAYKVKSSVKAMQEEVYKRGPFSTSFYMYDDFGKFFNANRTGIYTKKSGKKTGSHAVRIVGWGETNGEKYWLIANSWGEGWGDNGYFRMRRGTNECGIESKRLSAATPKWQADTHIDPIDLVEDDSDPSDLDGEKIRIPVDASVLELARFGLAQVLPQAANTESFHGVVEAYSQVVAGVLYDLKIAIASENGSRHIDVTIHEDPSGKLSVV